MSPLVDTQSTRRETVIKAETLADAAGDARLRIDHRDGAGAEHRRRRRRRRDDGTDDPRDDVLHGARRRQRRRPGLTNGLTLASPSAAAASPTLTYDIANSEEMQVLVSGGLGEAETGGPSINMVPKSGGNQFSGCGVLQHRRRLGHVEQRRR